MAEFTFQHYVPRTYLEAWENSDKRLKVHMKDTESSFYKRSNEVLGINNFYTLTADDSLVLNNDEKKSIFGFLRDYFIIFDGKTLSSLDDYSMNYYAFDHWVIKNNDDITVDPNSLQDIIKTNRMLAIEKGWHFIESEWNIIRQSIVEVFNDNTKKLDPSMVEKLIVFIASQKSRTVAKKDEYRSIIEPMFSFLKDETTTRDYDAIINEFSEAYFLNTLRKYQENQSDSIITYEQRKIKNLKIVLYKA